MVLITEFFRYFLKVVSLFILTEAFFAMFAPISEK